MTNERGNRVRTIGQIAAAVLLAIVALALHPQIGGHPGPQTALRELGSLGARDRLVHATLLVLLAALLAGLASFALHRGLTRRPVIVGLVGAAVGIGGLFAAGLIDGFVLPAVAARFVAASPAAQVAAVVTLTACGVAVNVSTAFGLVALALAIAAWSLDLLRDGRESRVAGIVGFVAASLTVAVLAAEGASLQPHALLAVVCAQGVWYVWIAVLFARGRA